MSKAENVLPEWTLPTWKLKNEYFDNLYKSQNRVLQIMDLIKCTPIIDIDDSKPKKIKNKNSDEEHTQNRRVVAVIKTTENPSFQHSPQCAPSIKD